MQYNFSGAPMSGARKMASQGQRMMRDSAADMTHGLHDMSDAAVDMASNYYRQGSRALRGSAGAVGHYVEEQPVRSTLVALGLGCLICALLIDR